MVMVDIVSWPSLGGVFVLLGTAVLYWKKEKENDKSMESRLGFWYSVDMLMPIIRLRDKHYDVTLKTRLAVYYFYVHKVVGYVLTFF